MKKLAAILILIVTVLCFAACSPAQKTARGFSMGSDYYVTYTSSADLDAEIAELLSSIEESFSVRKDGSFVSRINTAAVGGSISLTEEESAVLARCFALSDASDNAFDPAILPLVKVWGFDPPYLMNGEVLPAEDDIFTAALLSDKAFFIHSEQNKTLTKTASGAELDLGGAIKGYAAERTRDLMKQKAKEALVYVGGTIAAVGRDYSIGVTHPRDSSQDYLFRFELKKNEICATSGDYERYYEVAGRRYHHILDAKTGYPAASGVISATVISEDGLLADALATAVVVLGAEKGSKLLSDSGAKGAIVTSDNKVIAVGVSVTVKDKAYELK